MTTVATRAHNFNPGPAVLPHEVLEQARAELLNYQGCGMSVMEISHRSKEFESLIQRAESNLRQLLAIPASCKVMFLQGGANLQFAMAPMNLRSSGRSADYVVNGSWGKAALKEAQKLGASRVAASTEKSNFDRVSLPDELDPDPDAAYLHFTSNETIHGVQWNGEPAAPANVPLVCDMSSDFLSRPVDVSKYGLIYAGAQKNAGPAGVTLVIVREDLLERTPANLPVMLDYKALAASGSLHNTPPCFAIYVVGLVLQWLVGLGGLAAVARRNEQKAQIVYEVVDHSGGFYRGHARPESRSRMNVTLRLPSEPLEEQFVKEAKKCGMVGLKGHRSVGGIRASMYNALPKESALALADFMKEFQRANG